MARFGSRSRLGFNGGGGGDGRGGRRSSGRRSSGSRSSSGGGGDDGRGGRRSSGSRSSSGVGVAVVVGVVVALSVTENCALRSEAVVAGACTSVWLRSSLGAVN